MASSESLGLGWALRLVWAKAIGLVEQATSHHVPRPEAQGPTSLRPCTCGIIVMNFNEQWAWGGGCLRLVQLRYNSAALTLASAAKEDEEVIIRLEKCPSFLFPIVQHNFLE